MESCGEVISGDAHARSKSAYHLIISYRYVLCGLIRPGLQSHLESYGSFKFVDDPESHTSYTFFYLLRYFESHCPSSQANSLPPSSRSMISTTLYISTPFILLLMQPGLASLCHMILAFRQQCQLLTNLIQPGHDRPIPFNKSEYIILDPRVFTELFDHRLYLP